MTIALGFAIAWLTMAGCCAFMARKKSADQNELRISVGFFAVLAGIALWSHFGNIA